MKSDKGRFWIPVIIGLVLGAMTAAIKPWDAIENPLLNVLVYGLAWVFGFLLSEGPVFPVPFILQFPLYGLAIGLSRRSRKRVAIWIALGAVHALAVGAVMFWLIFMWNH